MTVTYRTAWRKNDKALESDATTIWTNAANLPQETSVTERLKEVALIAYEDDVPVALTTLNVQVYNPVRQKFAFIRGTVLPDKRLQAIGINLMIETYKMIEAYAKDHPAEAIAGMISVFQVPGIGEIPYGNSIGTVLIGYTNENQQVRLVWFKHFRVPPNMSPLPQI
jgi:hypothetical protein